MQTIKIPVGGKDHARTLEATLKKMKMGYRITHYRDYPYEVTVWYDEPIELYNLGATVVADAAQVFKSAITI
jgi:hypothetical protein